MRIQAPYVSVHETSREGLLINVHANEKSFIEEDRHYYRPLGYYRDAVILLPENSNGPIVIEGKKFTYMSLDEDTPDIKGATLGKFNIPEGCCFVKERWYGRDGLWVQKGFYYSKEQVVTTYVTTRTYELSMPIVLNAETRTKEEIPTT